MPCGPASPRRPVQNIPRTRRDWRPEPIAALECRALLAASTLDPSFGTSGVVLGVPEANPFSGGPTREVNAVAVQSDGKIVTAETIIVFGGTPALNPLVIRRYNANGSLDPSFGTGGQTVIPLAGSNPILDAVPHNLVITSTGQIVLAAVSAVDDALGDVISSESLVARLTSTGQLDSTFGTNGEFVLPGSLPEVDSVVVESSGRVVVAGTIESATGSGSVIPTEILVVGLTSAGTLDTSFGTGGQTAVPLASGTAQGVEGATLQVLGVRLTPSGQILVGGANQTPPQENGLDSPIDHSTTLSHLNADGAIDTSFGSGGTANVAIAGTSNGFAIQSDGSIVVVGGSYSDSGTFLQTIARVTATGEPDSSFQAPSATTTTSVVGFTSVVIGTDGTITLLNSDGALEQLTGTGAINTQFGVGGQAQVVIPTGLLPSGTSSTYYYYAALALTASGNVLAGGGITGYNGTALITTATVQQSVLAQVRPVPLNSVLNDYNGDGRSDLTAELTQYGVFAVGYTNGGSLLQPFGPTGPENSISAPGDYDGDGKADVAAYLPTLGIFAYRPSTGGADV